VPDAAGFDSDLLAGLLSDDDSLFDSFVEFEEGDDVPPFA